MTRQRAQPDRGVVRVQTMLRQVWIIARLQLSRVFFSKRSFWVYLLAIFPAVIFFGHGIFVQIQRARFAAVAKPTSVLEAIRPGDTADDVLARAGEPMSDFTFRNRQFGKKSRDDGPEIRRMSYTDGHRVWDLFFESGILQSANSRTLIDLEEDRRVFATVFQHFYLRLAIFFGCLGIFMNLFRGEMLDKTLHFWFLAPVRREVLLAGKYLAGLIAATLIFTVGAVIAYGGLLWGQEPSQTSALWRDYGATPILWYVASAALACVGYGSVFLAAGMLLRNPIIPAVVILIWEGSNPVLPAMLQKLSVLYYAQSLAPVPPLADPNAPALIRLLMSPAEPPSAIAAVAGLLALTAVVLWLAARSVRRLEVNYGTD
jgi:ABC-type transport system involved in multi-copper enzyme maturation permease subunit